jgi:hypothetical protein
MRQENLTVIKGGLSRLRTKGAALKDSLFELLNGFVTTEKTVKVRPGTILDATLPTGTVGLVSFDGDLVVFASSLIVGLPSGYISKVVRAPDGAALSKIHFAEPFLGALYVAAEFVGGAVFHFWLQATKAWAADTDYDVNSLVTPTTSDSFVYRATRLGAPFPVWTPSTPRAVGDKIEPTVYNGLFFEVISVVGTNPKSGLIEPDFDVAVGEVVIEDTDGTIPNPDPTPVPRPDYNEPDRDIFDRYGDRERK